MRKLERKVGQRGRESWGGKGGGWGVCWGSIDVLVVAKTIQQTARNPAKEVGQRMGMPLRFFWNIFKRDHQIANQY